MITDAIRLLLFPALIAFAASSDLLTMTISNRISLASAGGFLLLAIITGMSPATIAMHAGAATLVLAAGFACFSFGWIEDQPFLCAGAPRTRAWRRGVDATRVWAATRRHS